LEITKRDQSFAGDVSRKELESMFEIADSYSAIVNILDQKVTTDGILYGVEVKIEDPEKVESYWREVLFGLPTKCTLTLHPTLNWKGYYKK